MFHVPKLVEEFRLILLVGHESTSRQPHPAALVTLALGDTCRVKERPKVIIPIPIVLIRFTVEAGRQSGRIFAVFNEQRSSGHVGPQILSFRHKMQF